MKPLMTIALVAITTCAGMWMSRYEDILPKGRRSTARLVLYWFLTIVITFELSAGAIWDLLRIQYVRGMLAHLGYPLYLAIILGVWRIPGALVMVAPGLRRLKEWAYAGAIFNYTGAAASHFLAGDRAGEVMVPFIMAGLALISWSLRPQSRCLTDTSLVTHRRPTLWSVSLSIVAAMLLIGYLTLPAT